MNLLTILTNGLWAGLFAGGLSLLFTAPLQCVPSALLCGFAGCCVRDVLMSGGLTQNWSTVIAAAVVVLVGVAMIPRHVVSPVILVAGVLPLGAAVAMFNAIIELMKLSSLSGEALRKSSVALSANVGKAFTTSLAIAVGLGIGMAIIRLLHNPHTFQKPSRKEQL